MGSSKDSCWLDAVSGKYVWEKNTGWELGNLNPNPFSAINQLRRL